MQVPDFAHFYYDEDEKNYVWQRASYIEDGEYITTKDFKEFSIWSIALYGGFVSHIVDYDRFEDAVNYARGLA